MRLIERQSLVRLCSILGRFKQRRHWLNCQPLTFNYVCGSACVMPQHSLYIFCWLDHATRDHQERVFVCFYEEMSDKNLAGEKGALITEQSCPDSRQTVTCQFLHTVRVLCFTTFVIHLLSP
jgi:hypothetical protein